MPLTIAFGLRDKVMFKDTAKSCKKIGICAVVISCHGDFTFCAVTSAFCYDEYGRVNKCNDRVNMEI